ncbi:TPA: hypothetical protein ACS2QJ_004314 [Yersinia enterocolitica]
MQTEPLVIGQRRDPLDQGADITLRYLHSLRGGYGPKPKAQTIDVKTSKSTIPAKSQYEKSMERTRKVVITRQRRKYGGIA